MTLARYEVEGPTGLRTPGDRLPGGRERSGLSRTRAGAPAAGGYTYGDFAKIRGGAEVHDDGEIWAQTLWQLRRRLIHGVRIGARASRARARS